MAQVKINNLTFKYPECKKNALENINIEIEEGELCLVIGKSGSGKSTLLNLLMKDSSVNGTIEGSIDIGTKKTAILNQHVESNVIHDTVFGELAFYPSNLGYNRTEVLCKVAETANYFNLTEYVDDKTETLSGGTKQILALASIMIGSPDILLLDEPTSQLDPVSSELFINTVLKLNREFGMTVVITEHRADDLLTMADKIIMLKDGKLQFSLKGQSAADRLIDDNDEMKYILPTYSLVLPHHQINFTSAKDEEHKLITKDIYKETDKVDIGLEAKNIFFSYDNKKEILKFLNYKAYKGKINAIVGANGTGKTTFLKCLASILKPQSGKIKKNGKSAYLPQNVKTLFLEDTVVDEAEGNTKLLEEFELKQIGNHSPMDISLGEQQRLALLKVINVGADIILLDEPSKSIDVVFKLKLGKMLQKLANDGKTIIIALHDLEFAAEYSDFISLMFNHEIIYTDNPHNFFSSFKMYTTSLSRLTSGRVVSIREAELNG